MANHPHPLSQQLETVSLPVEIPMSFLHLNAGTGKPLLLLFHGYEDTGAGVFRRTLSEADVYSKFEILAPNGLFPMPVRVEGGYKQTHAWYFADYSRKQVLIPPDVSANAIQKLIEKLNLQDRPKILIGFSQGAFFIPFVLPQLQNIKKMFGIAGGFRAADYPKTLPAPIDAIHGDEDPIISLSLALEGFEKLKMQNPQGQFHNFAGLKHSMNDASRALLKTKIDEVFA